MHQNIAGLLAKSGTLTVCLCELLGKGIQVDLLCITEHFMMEGYEVHLNIPNYCLAACFSRKENKRGGACILIKNGHQWRELPKIAKLSITGIFECCAIELIDCKVVIVCIYRVPNPSNFDEFMSRLEILLRALINKSSKNIVLAGDFNIDILKKNKQSLEFESLLLSYNLKLSIRQPTRLKSKTCIDNFAHNFDRCRNAIVLELALSDHTAQLLNCPISTTSTRNHWRTIRRDYSKENIDKFKTYLNGLSFAEVYEAKDPNIAYNAFIEMFSFLYTQCFPETLICVKVKRRPSWVSHGIKICSKKKRHLLWQYRQKPTNINKNKFKSYSKLFKKIINLTQRAQNIHKIKKSNNKSKTTWEIINQTKLNIPKNTIDKILYNNETVTEPKIIANIFNDYFIDKIEPITSSGTTVAKQILIRKDSMFMAPSIALDILKIIATLKNTNSVGYDGICTKIVKTVAYEISEPISHIINLSISEGIFPNALKKSIVKPLFKKQDRELIECYRPISLVPIISKIIEKYIYREFNAYFEKNHILCDEQKGFREKKTINLAIYDFLRTVMTNMDKNTQVCAIFCDMTQAFDYVQHDILLKKLDAYGIRGNIFNLIQSYLHDRQQVTQISRINMSSKREEIFTSCERIVPHGVPQGSVLGPLMFTLYINDFPKSIKYPMTLFADDSTITIPCHNKYTYETDIKNTLIEAVTWLNNNNLKININKTLIMHFSQRSLLFSTLDIKYNNNKIQTANTTKFLGLTIDRNLNWKAHIEALAKRISSGAYALYKLSRVLNIEALLTAYHGLVESVIRYGVIFWGNSTDRDIVFKRQKYCLRSMFNLKTTDSCKNYFTKYRILTLPSLYILEIAMFVKTNPQLFPRMADKFPRNRRDDSKLCLHSSKTALMHKSVFCMAPIIYNKLPKSLKELTIPKFKQTLKLILAQKAYYSITEFLNDL